MNIMLLLVFGVISVYCLTQKPKMNSQKIEKYEKPILLGLFFVGIFVRLFLFWKFPQGLNQDEASIGYDAFADVFFGMDRNGWHNPVYSVAWGSGHSGLYLWLLKLSVRLFGLSVFSVRIINCIFGTLGLFAFYGTLRRLKGKSFAILGLFFLVICPWHIMMCRWGLECNLLPNVFFIGLYCFVRAKENQAWFLVSAFLFGLCLYAYGTACIFIPVFLAAALIYLWKNRKITLKYTVLSGLLFIITAVPIGIFIVINVFNLPALDLGFISFPKLVEGRYHTTVTVLQGNFFNKIAENVKEFCRLVIFQNDGLPWNVIPAFGTIYLFSLPFMFLGIFSVLKDRENKSRYLVFPMLPAALVLAAVSRLNINRGNIIMVLILYCSVEGIYFAMQRIKRVVFPVICIYCIGFCLFCGVYFTTYQTQIGHDFFNGFGKAVKEAAQATEGPVYLTDSVNAPYIYALFYQQTDSRRFLETVEYKNPQSSVREVVSFDRFVTGLPEEKEPAYLAAYVANAKEAAGFDEQFFKKTNIKNYYVITPK